MSNAVAYLHRAAEPCETPDRHTDVSLAQLVRNIGSELDRLADSTDGLHDAVCDPERGPSDSEFIRSIQSIDLHAQVMRNLAEVMGNLAAILPGIESVAAGSLDTVTLSDLKRRLLVGTGQAEVEAIAEEAESGVLDLF